MKLLFVTHFFPYPPTDGGHIGYYNPLKYLSRKVEITLVSLVNADSVPFIDEMKRYCVDVRTHHLQRVTYAALARGLVGMPPGAAAKYYDPAFGVLIRNVIDEQHIDLVEFQHLNTAAYRPFVTGVPVILREHNVEYKVWERHAATAQGFWERTYVSAVAPRVRAYEAKAALCFDRCITVSEADAEHLKKVAPTARVETIPSGVDTEIFLPDGNLPRKPYSMVLTGSFEWKPKQHNLRVLLTEIYPRIKAKLPEATLQVVGKGVPEEIHQVARRLPGVTITGAVQDVRPYVQRTALSLNYLESGGGIALKVLEAMAMCTPVLSNSLGCEGISVTHGEDVFLADGLHAFSDAAVLLLQNETLRERIARGGYRLVQRKYAWDCLADQFIACYGSILEDQLSTDVSREPVVPGNACS